VQSCSSNTQDFSIKVIVNSDLGKLWSRFRNGSAYIEWIVGNKNGPDGLTGYVLYTTAIMAEYNSRPHRSHSDVSTRHKSIISSNYYTNHASFQVTLSHIRTIPLYHWILTYAFLQ